ncbi:MAG TPA: 2-oxo-4-hydroxy-4-carboxy-5-ureidoimidazoline decarboxylase [Catalimonadaceae bacterium]|nr:2-oxo-4-hydroxy-4-carboxy-5-ureidoimidazoline decarboxylase [Catalimonadaceae bacterium]
MTLSEFNQLDEQKAFDALFSCCGSSDWARQLLAKRPFNNLDALKKESDLIWLFSKEPDWIEAFSHHPKIGDKASLETKFAKTKTWAAGEQSGVDGADSDVIAELAKANADYERKFRFIFIVCATGKSAEEMLKMLKTRLNNKREQELLIAMTEQNKITHIRLDKLFL